MAAARDWARRNQVLLDSLLIVALALALRLPNLEGWPRPLADEGAYGYTGYYYFQGQFGKPYLYPGFNTPLMMGLFGMMTTLFGRSFFALRLSGVLLGGATCLLLYLVGRRLYGRWTGLLGGLLLALASVYANRSALLDNGVAFSAMLALWGYLRLRDKPQTRWGGLVGVAAGLSVLSKYAGAMTPLFILFQWLADRRPASRALMAGLAIFLALAAIYPLIGAIAGWNYFLADILPPSRRGAEAVSSLTEALLLGRPVDQLNWDARFGLSLWGTGGLLSLFYLLGRGGRRGGPIFAYVAAALATYVVIGSNFWWGFLIPLYPAYCLALAVVIRDALVRPGAPYLALSFFLLLLPTVSGDEALPMPPGWGRWGFFLLVAASLIPLLAQRRRRVPGLAVARSHNPGWPTMAFRGLAGLVIGLALVATAAGDLRPLLSDATADMRQVAAYLGTNLRSGGTAAVASPIAYLLGESGIPYTDVAFYATRIEFADYTLAERYPRFTRDLALQNITYFVLDTPFAGLGTWNAVLKPFLDTNWLLVTILGDYQVYRNPAFPAAAVLARDDDLADLAQAELALSDLLVVRNDAAEKVSGANSLRIDLDLKEEHTLHLYTLTEPEDWSAVEALSFWWYGDQVGPVTLDLLTPTQGAYYRLAFEDDWTGWRQLRLALSQATPIGAPSGWTVRGLALTFQSRPVSGTVRLDDLRLQPRAD